MRKKGQGRVVGDRWVHPDAVIARRELINCAGHYYENDITKAVLV